MWNIDRVFWRAAVSAGFLTMAAFLAAPASAACFEDIGCTDSDWYEVDVLRYMTCETLERISDRIDEENEDEDELNRVERHNQDVVDEAESEAGC
jgi:hypothetical protein